MCCCVSSDSYKKLVPTEDLRMDERKWRLSALFWGVLIAFATLTFIYNLAEVKTMANSGFVLTSSETVEKPAAFVQEAAVKGFLIKTPGCTIPDLNIMDPLIKQYIFRERAVICNKGLPALYEANRTAIYQVEEATEYYGIVDPAKLSCCYQYFHRAPPIRNKADKSVIYNETCHPVDGSASVHPNEEFLRIKCQYKSKEIYKDFFSFVPIRNTDSNTGRDKTQQEDKLNILVIGIDAVSRLNFHRQMPKTAFYLEKLKAVELLGYNKIGDNTFPNLIAALTGYSETELKNHGWPKEESYFDNCSFVWNEYKRRGYTTVFGEDAAWMGLFYYTKRGFFRQPTDYFYDHFDLTATTEAGNNHRLNVDQCIGSRQSHLVFLSYIENFVLTMNENLKKFFAFFWSASLTHDFLNKPRLGDQDYLNLLFTLDEEGILNKTALLVMSDHGIRWGSIRSTYQGRMEERLPFLYILLPPWYREKHPEMSHNLIVNIRRLTTPFDLYETFLDLLEPHRIPNESVNPRGISLFRDIPKNRTCKTAGIEQHWCTCQQSVKIDVEAIEAQEAVNHTITYINDLLVGYADCLPLTLDSIIEARELINDNSINKYAKSLTDYTVTFKTEPGGAIFEATVRKDMQPSAAVQFSVTGTVSRINLYGSQSKCISDFHLKLYCYCRTYLGN